MSADNKALSRRLLDEAFNKGNVDIADEVLTSGFVNHDAALPEATVGVEAAKASMTGYRTAFPDMQFTIEDQFDSGDEVVTRWSARGTHQGDLMGIPPTGKQATVTGITIDRIEGSRIAESWTNWDTLGLMQQLGAIPTGAAKTSA